MGFAGADQLAKQGALQQQFSQQQLDAIRNLPLEQQQILNQALGINVGGGSGIQQSSTSRQGLLGLLGIG
jgi:phosphoribosylaminoimidazole carboxylase (NCAIR synthetase)